MRMNYSNPILICNENEEFRILIRDMLTKNGFFHILEASTKEEALEILSDKRDFFVLVEAKAVSPEMISSMNQNKNYIIFADNHDPKTLSLSAKVGVEHVMSYPFHSKKLLEKISRLL